MGKRIFLGPVEISGYYSKLAKGLVEIGYDVSFFVRFRHKSGYSIQNRHFLLRLHRFISDKRVSIGQNKIVLKASFVVLQFVLERILFVYFLFTHQVFIYTFMQTFFRNSVDLKILKLLNKKIIFISNGSDLRPPYLGNLWDTYDCKDINIMIEQISREKKKYLKKVEKYADIIIGGIFRSQFLEKPFVERSFLGRPVYEKDVVSDKDSISSLSEKNNVHIIHAPSAKHLKGTDEIIQAVNNLVKTGFNIEFELIENKSNSYVINAMLSCDFIIDQLYSDILLPGLASEAALYSKAAIVGGYELDALKKYLPRDLIPPVFHCRPEEIEEAIKLLIVDCDLREKIGKKSNEFIKTKSHFKKVALNYQKLIEDRIPYNWYINPYEVMHIHGVGLNKNIRKEKLKDFIENRGIGALQISDKPLLENKFIEFINKNK